MRRGKEKRKRRKMREEGQVSDTLDEKRGENQGKEEQKVTEWKRR